MTGNEDVYVIVPAYNESTVVGQVITDLRSVFAHVICVDDGSRDETALVAESCGATVIHHQVNVGQGAAIQTGIMYGLGRTDAHYLVTFDADGQHRVSDALAMLEVARTGDVDVVLGSRFLAPDLSGVPASRRTILRAAARFTRWTSGLAVTDAHNGLRVLNRHAASRLNITLNGMAHASEIVEQISRHKLRWTEHSVTIDYTEYSRAKGQSNINAVNISLDVLGRRLRAGR